MKYFLILAVLALLVFVMGVRKGARAPKDGPQAPKPQRGPLLACAHCGLLLPGAEALPGRGGQFCCAEHRSRYEAEHPTP